MIRGVAGAAVALLAGAVLGAAVPLTAASGQTVDVLGPPDEPIRSVTPTFTVAAAGFTPAQQPVTLRLLVATDAAFENPIVDTSLTADTAVIILTSPLPEGVPLFWRASAEGADGTRVTSATTGPRSVRRWLILVSPNVPTGTTLGTRRPTFVWSSAAVAVPPGPWRYSFDLLRSNNPVPVFTATGLVDTTFTPGFDLDLNTSYRWRVTARLANGDSTRVSSAATFVIVQPGRPVATLLYQNFPNPFPRGSVAATCIWFDLRDPATVRLEIYDIRANLVRRIVPSAAVSGVLPAGRYGRSAGEDESGCDPVYAWDGMADDGRLAAPGVYLLRLTADGRTLTRRILFRGR